MKILLILLVLLIQGCLETNKDHEFNGYKNIEVSKSPTKLFVPKDIVSEIEHDYIRAMETREKQSSEDELEMIARIPRQLMNISVLLKQKTTGSLHNDYRLHMPVGGGVLDLKDFVSTKRGSFFFKIGVKKNGTPVDGNVRVIYVSDSHSRLIGKERFGNGCGKYMDISKYFHKKIRSNGVMVNTTDQRYLSTMAGIYIFSSVEDGMLNLAYLRIVDSRYKKYQCNELAISENRN